LLKQGSAFVKTALYPKVVLLTSTIYLKDFQGYQGEEARLSDISVVHTVINRDVIKRIVHLGVGLRRMRKLRGGVMNSTIYHKFE
jgi:hypothetical protein